MGAIGSSWYMMKAAEQRAPGHHDEFLVKLVEAIDPMDPVNGLRRLEALKTDDRKDPFRLAVAGVGGRFLGGDSRAMRGLSPEDLPAGPYESRRFGSWPASGVVTRFGGTAARYLVTSAPRFPGPPPPGAPPPPVFFIGPVFLVTALSMVLGIAFAVAIIFRSFRQQVKMADHVIGEIHRGNLKARFPVERNDEIGRAMERFNRMADEIEILVQKLETAQQARNAMLQELAHDLRTPVASLRSMTETIFQRISIPPDLTEISNLALREIEYISRLVEDLLLLSQVSDQRYRAQPAPVDLMALFKDEGEGLQSRFGRKFELRSGTREALVLGDGQLLQRLARNSLENAFSFAVSRVEVLVEANSNQVRVLVSDDGPGFDEKSLAEFGVRRGRRQIEARRGNRLSLGLGSVIMKAIVFAHGGTLTPRNAPLGGGELEIVIPTD